MATKGTVLYRSAFRSLDGESALQLTYDGVTVAGFDPSNATDWRDWSLFRVDDGVTNLQVTLEEDRTLDAFGWYVVPPTELTGDYTMTLQWRDTGAWNTLCTVNINDNGNLGIATFTAQLVPTTGQVRVQFNVPSGQSLDVRCLCPGYKLQFPTGQHEGIAPPNLRGGIVVTNNISEGGSFLGRNVIRRDIKGDIILMNLTESWVRNYWMDFQAHAERFAFFYAWDRPRYPGEVCFAWAREIRPPENARAARMSVNMPWSAKTEDEPTVPYEEVPVNVPEAPQFDNPITVLDLEEMVSSYSDTVFSLESIQI